MFICYHPDFIVAGISDVSFIEAHKNLVDSLDEPSLQYMECLFYKKGQEFAINMIPKENA